MRFGRSIRYFCSALFIVSQVLYLPIAIYVPALTFSQISGVGVHTITPIVCLVCTFYTSVGGLKAVVWTDVVQSFIMYGTMLTICIKGTFDLGGLWAVLERNAAGGRLNMPDLTWDPTVRLSMASVIIGGTLHKIQSSDVNQVTVQRFLSLPGLKQVKRTLCIYTICLVFLTGCCCYMGLLVYATYYDCDPLTTKLTSASDRLPTMLVMRILGNIPGLPGCFVAGVFSAALSTLSTGLNSLACVITQDVIKQLWKKPITDRQMKIMLQLIVVIFGLICMGLIFIVEKLGMVLQLATMTGAVCMGPLLGMYIMGVCCPWINGKSAFAGSLVSFLTLSWICFQAQLAQINGVVHHKKLPVSVKGCTYTFDNSSFLLHNQTVFSDDERNIYDLSFLWYTGFGGILAVLVGAFSVLIFGTNNPDEVDRALISPLLLRFLPERPPEYAMVDLKDSTDKKRVMETPIIEEENEELFKKEMVY